MMREIREPTASSNVLRMTERRGVGGTSRKGASCPTGDRSGVSDRARELASAEEAVRAAPETRSLKVAVLRAAIANGTYRPDPHAIAREILERGL